MNYEDLLWKCQGILNSKDYMRLAGLITAEVMLRVERKDLLGALHDIVNMPEFNGTTDNSRIRLAAKHRAQDVLKQYTT